MEKLIYYLHYVIFILNIPHNISILYAHIILNSDGIISYKLYNII